MAKAKKIKGEAAPKPRDPERAARRRRVLINLALGTAFAGVCAAAVFFARDYVDREVADTRGPLIVVVKNRPRWMTDLLVHQIADAAQPPAPAQAIDAAIGQRPNTGKHSNLSAVNAPDTTTRSGFSSFDHDLLVKTRERLEANPWVLRVRQVRRAYTQKPGDTIEIDCDYRVPVALVKWNTAYWLIDRDGYKLPEQYSSRDVPKVVMGEDKHTNIRIIEGVRRPPPEAGRPWPGDDLAAGLQMVWVLSDHPYTDEIVKVNVANFEGRVDAREAHIVLSTRYGTDIRWGRPPNDRQSFEVPAGQKLDNLRRVYDQYGRVDARQPWLDLRFDAMRAPGNLASAGANVR